MVTAVTVCACLHAVKDQRTGRYTVASKTQAEHIVNSKCLVKLTSGAGPVKAITSCMVSLSSVSVMVPILPVVAAVGTELLLSLAAVHLRLAVL